MPLTEKPIFVRASKGQTNNDRPPHAVEEYVLDLDYASPRTVLVAGTNADDDMLALQSAVMAKLANGSNEELSLGATEEIGHVIDPDHPGTWTSAAGTRGIVYKGYTGSTQDFFIGFHIE